MGPAIFVPIFRKSDNSEENKMSGCGCSFSPAEEIKEEVKYTDALAEQFAKEVGVDPRPNETLVEIDERGAFIRQPNAFIQPFGDEEGDLKAEANRYGIYWATGCNWSNRPIIVRDLLESWLISKCMSVAVSLADIKEKKAVNNDYHRLTNYIEVQFRPFQPKDAPDLYPKKFRKEIDEFNDWLFPHVNNGHYRMAFCQSPEAYDEAYEDFYESLEKLDKRLETNRFLFGDYITDSDVRVYVTLVRWDVSYFHNIGPVKKPIRDYKNIWGYLRELYAIPAFRHGSDPQVLALDGPRKKLGEVLFRGYNDRILSKVDFEKLWADDGERRKLSKTPDELFLRHPEGETYEDYAGPISKTIWNSPKWEDRNPKNGTLSVDASINPLKGLL